MIQPFSTAVLDDLNSRSNVSELCEQATIALVISHNPLDSFSDTILNLPYSFALASSKEI